MFRRTTTLAAALLLALAGEGAIVRVKQQTAANGTTNVISDVLEETAILRRTVAAPAISGFAFTHWTIEPETVSGFSNRDRWNRALDKAEYTPYEDVTLTANYLRTGEDADGDGVDDAAEIYWYGTLDAATHETDTDGDGLGFGQEIELGTNPHFADCNVHGGVEVLAGAGSVLFNPRNLSRYVLRCEPEGRLFASSTNYAATGETVATPSFSPAESQFAYWSINGERQTDAFGRSKGKLTFAMPEEDIEIVAVCKFDERLRWFMHYGVDERDGDFDADGDGAAFVQEIELGTNPFLRDTHIAGGVETLENTGTILYNPRNLQICVIRSEPENKLFSTISNLVSAGTAVSAPELNPDNTEFAYWTLNGERQTNSFGVAERSVSFVMGEGRMELVAVALRDKYERMSEYWYGNSSVSRDSDTDGDGITFSEELDLGTCPLLADSFLPGGVDSICGSILEANLQPYEQGEGALVDGKYVQLFTSHFAGNFAESMTFGRHAAPAFVDWNGDGLQDVLILYRGGAKLYVNVGEKNRPEFSDCQLPEAFALPVAGMERPIPAGGSGVVYVSDNFGRVLRYSISGETWSDGGMDGVPAVIGGILCAMGRDGNLLTNGTVRLELDVPIENGTGLAFADLDGDGFTDLLVSDGAGRIWNYRNDGSGKFILRDKIWGGSSEGFADGLVISAYDWEGDGDVDCLCGTADGKVLLLKNPDAGRPTGLVAVAGADNVFLNWDANTQSSVRGYKVYRSIAGKDDWRHIAAPFVALARHRDEPEAYGAYDYRVSSVRRYYAAGNSTPVVRESAKSEPARAELGKIAFAWNDGAAYEGETAEVVLSIENSSGISAAGGEMEVSFDASMLELWDVIASGLTQGARISHDGSGSGRCSVAFAGGEISAGSGSFLSFKFKAIRPGNARVAMERCFFSARNGRALDSVRPSSDATVAIAEKSPGAEPGTVPPWSLGDVNGDGRITKEDLQRLSMLKQGNGNKWTELELKAGDFNSNGKLDNYDHARLRELLKELGAKGGGE